MKKETKAISRLDAILERINELNETKMAFLKERVLLIQGKTTKEEVLSKQEAVQAIKEEFTALSVEGLALADITAEQYSLLKGALPLTDEEYSKGIFVEYADKLLALREKGEYEYGRLSDAIKTLKLKRNVDKEERAAKLEEMEAQLQVAKDIMKTNAAEVKELRNEYCKIAKLYGSEIKLHVKYVAEFNLDAAVRVRKEKMLAENDLYQNNLEQASDDNRKFIKLQHKSNVSDINREYEDAVAKEKDSAYGAYLSLYNLYRHARNNSLTFGQKCQYRAVKYKHNFTVGGWFLKNALYLVILAFFLICLAVSLSKGQNLLTLDTVKLILAQSSTKVFFSLGVAGLILLGGTDLSIGRMTGMSASFACLFLSIGGSYPTVFGQITTPTNIAVAVILGLLASVLSTVIFSVLAGFFTAKFKMHPFITTLATQLIIFGVMMVCFGQVSNFTMDSGIASAIRGQSDWQLILYAAILVVIIWFIWNKTKFGRNMYAVGDNQEAAKVSGINVFWVTMGVFILAGVCYGFGGFFEGARIGGANPTLGAGTELDAIAACVIGGVSFSGGRGKVSGVVIGTIIFSLLTVCLSSIGLSLNYQFIFKGIIILAAVCLDSLKLVKKQ